MAGYYNPKKDYAAAIKSEKNPAKKEQLKAERQNKIDAMNAAGTNKKGYTNSIYGGSYSSSGKGNSPPAEAEREPAAAAILTKIWTTRQPSGTRKTP